MEELGFEVSYKEEEVTNQIKSTYKNITRIFYKREDFWMNLFLSQNTNTK